MGCFLRYRLRGPRAASSSTSMILSDLHTPIILTTYSWSSCDINLASVINSFCVSVHYYINSKIADQPYSTSPNDTADYTIQPQTILLSLSPYYTTPFIKPHTKPHSSMHQNPPYYHTTPPQQKDRSFSKSSRPQAPFYPGVYIVPASQSQSCRSPAQFLESGH